jgi:hypothetical protein
MPGAKPDFAHCSAMSQISAPDEGHTKHRLCCPVYPCFLRKLCHLHADCVSAPLSSSFQICARRSRLYVQTARAQCTHVTSLPLNSASTSRGYGVCAGYNLDVTYHAIADRENKYQL